MPDMEILQHVALILYIVISLVFYGLGYKIGQHGVFVVQVESKKKYEKLKREYVMQQKELAESKAMRLMYVEMLARGKENMQNGM